MHFLDMVMAQIMTIESRETYGQFLPYYIHVQALTGLFHSYSHSHMIIHV